MISCDPNSLASAARCFACLPLTTLQSVETYLLCQWMGDSCDVPAPTNFLVLGYAVGSATVQWTFAGEPALDFLLCYGDTPGGPYPNCFSYPANQSGGVVPFDNDGTYYGVVYARDSEVCLSPASNQATIVIGDPCGDSVPVTIDLIEVLRGSFGGYEACVYFGFEHPELVTEYQLWRSTDGVSYDQITSNPTEPLCDTGGLGLLTPETDYWYKVVSVFNNGCPDASVAQMFNSGCHVVAPANLEVTDTKETEIDLAWTITVGPVLKYTIFWGITPGGPYPFSQDVPAGDTSVTVGSLLSATTYYFVVYALDSLTCVSSASNEVSGETS